MWWQLYPRRNYLRARQKKLVFKHKILHLMCVYYPTLIWNDGNCTSAIAAQMKTQVKMYYRQILTRLDLVTDCCVWPSGRSRTISVYYQMWPRVFNYKPSCRSDKRMCEAMWWKTFFLKTSLVWALSSPFSWPEYVAVVVLRMFHHVSLS